MKAYRVVKFERLMQTLEAAVPHCHRILVDVGVEKWSRAHQDGLRYAYMTSNSAESMNALTRYARKLPITMLMEFFQASVQQRYFRKRTHAGMIFF